MEMISKVIHSLAAFRMYVHGNICKYAEIIVVNSNRNIINVSFIILDSIFYR